MKSSDSTASKTSLLHGMRFSPSPTFQSREKHISQNKERHWLDERWVEAVILNDAAFKVNDCGKALVSCLCGNERQLLSKKAETSCSKGMSFARRFTDGLRYTRPEAGARVRLASRKSQQHLSSSSASGGPEAGRPSGPRASQGWRGGSNDVRSRLPLTLKHS